MRNHRRIVVEPGSDLDHALDDADGTLVELERGGLRYFVVPAVSLVEPDDIWAGYDAKRTERILRDVAGGWSGIVEAETLKAYVAERRRTANRQSPVV